MEIKVICECGTKYKFDVEPVNGHMPQAVKCPACGANGTAKANAAIREGLGIAAPPVEAAPAAPVASSAPVASPAPVRLSVQRPAGHAAPASQEYPGAVSLGGISTGGISAGAGAAAAASADGGSTLWAVRGKKALQLVWKGVLVLLCVVAMLAGFGGKKGKRLRFLAKITSAVIKSNADDEEDGERYNIWGEDMVLLLVRHTNETEVVEVCASFWQDTYKKKVTFVATNETDEFEFEFDGNQIGIIPAHKACVQIVGGLKWPKEDFEKLTQLLSEKLNTTAVETRDVSFSGGYIFGVFENGEKKFRAEMELKGKTLQDLEQSVTVEGEEWARAHGYKPGKEGFKEFHLGDADRITRRLGFNLSEHVWDRFLVLNEVTDPPPVKVIPARAGKAATK